MKSVKLAVAVCCISMIGAAAHAAGEPPALTPFYQFADAMNAGDTNKAAALFVPSAPIIDEFSPYAWKSFGDWNHDFSAFFKAGGGSDFHMTVSAPSFKNVDATHGYGVLPTTLTYKIKGKAVTEKGLFTVSTAKAMDGWHITGWAWSTL
ncbi:MAG TPA: hypothetical protein VIJ85_08070 [Rhizomicrobium sp.]